MSEAEYLGMKIDLNIELLRIFPDGKMRIGCAKCGNTVKQQFEPEALIQILEATITAIKEQQYGLTGN